MTDIEVTKPASVAVLICSSANYECRKERAFISYGICIEVTISVNAL